MAKINKVWNVYFRDTKNGVPDWEWQCSIPPLVVETFEKDGKTSPGDQWYNDGDELDLAEGRAALQVLWNQGVGMEGRYALEECKKDSEPLEPVPVTFNCKRHY